MSYRSKPSSTQYNVDDWAATFAYGKSGYKGVDPDYQEALTSLHAHDDLGSRLGGPTTRPKRRSED